MPGLPNLPGLPGLPGSSSSSSSLPSAMPPPLPGMMMPNAPYNNNMPQVPQTYPQLPGGGGGAPPSVPSSIRSNPAAVPSPAVEPTAQGINETLCQAVHVPPEENFFTVSVVYCVQCPRSFVAFAKLHYYWVYRNNNNNDDDLGLKLPYLEIMARVNVLSPNASYNSAQVS